LREQCLYLFSAVSTRHHKSPLINHVAAMTHVLWFHSENLHRFVVYKPHSFTVLLRDWHG